MSDYLLCPDDFIQSAYLSLRNKTPKPKDKDAFDFKNYISISVKNLFIDHVRRNNRFQVVPLERARRISYEEPTQEKSYKELHSAIDDLPEPQKIVMLLRLKGYKYFEIAQETKSPINTARGRFRYASMAIRKNQAIET